MSIILVTGPIASGKSHFVKRAFHYLCAQKIPATTIQLDALGKRALAMPEVKAGLVNAFGDDVVENGSVVAERLAHRAFATGEATAQLNKLTHPTIGRLAQAQIDEFLAREPRGVVLIETPFPAEYLSREGFGPLLSWTLAVVIDAPREERLRRCVGRIADASRRDALQQNYGAYAGATIIHNDASEEVFDARIDDFCATLGEIV